MSKRNWFEMGHALVECYRVSQLNSTLKNLPLEVFITAVASFSGPIALLENKGISHQFILPSYCADSITILNCRGEFKKSIPYKMKDHIIFFGFTKWEELLIVDASGDFWLIDPFSSNTTQGNYTKEPLVSLQANEKKEKERYRGCILLEQSNKLVLLRQKSLGYVDSPTGWWKPLPNLKPSIENPLFSEIKNSPKADISSTEEFVYLTKFHTIEAFNLQSEKRDTLYSGEYLSQNSDNLVTVSYSREANKLALFFSNPTLISIVDIGSGEADHMDPLIDLRYTLPTGKIVDGKPEISERRISHSKYLSTSYKVCWVSGSSFLESDMEYVEKIQLQEQGRQLHLNKDLVMFGNPHLTIIVDGENIRMGPINSNNYIVRPEIDCVRVYGEEYHEIYRIVPYLYQTLVDIDLNQITEGHHIPTYANILELHEIYTSYLNGQVIDILRLNKLGGLEAPKTLEEGEREKLPEERIFNNEKVEEEVLMPLLAAGRYCLDPVDQSKLFKFLCFVKNYYTSQMDISETCGQLRVINNLKFQFLNRSLTLSQFEFLKYDYKAIFLTILLRYNMHFAADVIFGDSQSKVTIFMDWAKCKIEKNGDTLAFQEIRAKFEGFGNKDRDSRVFTEIAKYCIDRNKFSLAQSFVELEEVPQRKVMVLLLLLAAKKDKKLVEKILQTAEECIRSQLLFKVIKDLIEATWIENHLWVNILYGRPNVERHYLQYLKKTGQNSLLKAYYLQNKNYEELGYEVIRGLLPGIDQEPHNLQKNSIEGVETIRQKIGEFQKLLPSLAGVVKSHQSNPHIEMLRKAKSGEAFPSEEELKNIKNDTVCEYLGQILMSKDQIQLGIISLCQIKSPKVYKILQRKGRFRDAIELAWQRKDKAALEDIGERCPEELEEEVQSRLRTLKAS